MTVTRHRFDVRTDTGGGFVDSGAAFRGYVAQVRWDATPLPGDTGIPDTGADLTLTLQPSGVTVGKYDNELGASFTKSPHQPAHDTGGQALADSVRDRVYGAMDHLKVEVLDTGGNGGSKSGTLHVYTVE